MRVFPTLCYRASRQGVRKLVFVAQLDDDSWTVEAYTSTKRWSAVASAAGKTGQEALSNLVDKLEAL